MQVPFADPLLNVAVQNTIAPLVGRETEIQVISALLDTVARDKPVGIRALIISGEAGVGKSRLLAEMYQESRVQGFSVLETHLYELGMMFPLLPFVEALRPVVRMFTPSQLRRYTGLDTSTSDPAISTLSLSGLPLVAALSQLFPELAIRLNLALPPRELLSPDQEKFRLFDSIATLLEHMAEEQPVLLSIDNLQWADSASLELTLYLTVRLRRSRVALVGAVRPTAFAADQAGSVGAAEAAAGAAKILGKLVRQGLLLFLPLSSLSENAAQQYLHFLLPGMLPTEIAQSLLRRAEGNPYFLEELVRTLTLDERLVLRNGSWQADRPLEMEALPQSIALAVEEQISELAWREMLQVAALFGRTFPQEPLVEVLRKEPEYISSLLNEALGQKLIARGSQNEDHLTETAKLSTFVFCRGIVQEALYAGISPQRAITLHGAIGRALERYYGTTTSVHASELARHYLLGDCKPEALYWNMRAGEEAIRQQTYREAITYLHSVLRLLEAGTQSTGSREKVSVSQVYLSLGECWFKLGDLTRSADAFRQILERQDDAAVEHSRLLLLAKANRLLGDTYRMEGKFELALAHLRTADRLLANKERGGSIQEAANDASQPEQPLSDISSVESQNRLRPRDKTERVLLLQARATLAILCARPDEARTELQESYQLATELGDRSSQAFALHFLGWLCGWGEHIAETTRLISQARDLYIANGDPFHAVLGDQSLGTIYQVIGEMEKARFYNLHGFEQAQRYGIQQIVGWLHCNQGIMALALGNWEECDLHFQNALQEAEDNSNTRLKALAVQAQAFMHFRRGLWPEAEHLFQSAVAVAVNTEWHLSTQALYGYFLAVTGREVPALVQLERVESEPEPFGYSAHFYIPFLAEAHLHLQKTSQAETYSEQIRSLRGFAYYGVSVDRILGEIAAQQGKWKAADQAFEEGLAFCQHAHHRPEEATILYEQARTMLMRSQADAQISASTAIARIHELCGRARALFLEYRMQRAADLVDTLLEGVEQLENRIQTNAEKSLSSVTPSHLAHAEYQLELRLTRRELEVLRLVAEGHTDREVADALVLSPRTVNRHLSNIFTRLDVPGRAAAVAYAIRQGLVK